ncbi:hypothetical protein PV08_02985 [Exophiala spinifera]|uniref:Spindle pole body component n=1 Tax=Exophiala spinifera TaxID=91928 RepID=A0A0D1YTV8_9EURO|nr:uncharacterized protein PV08_02985 [Exophiala spinifera]KIW18696.1 hypothetical protein PV08_02985 [Exophiala spinifera]
MASTTSMNNWIEQLAASLVPLSASPAAHRKYKESFARKIKYHVHARTNQFAVAEKLTGLEEKFQVLNLDDLAQALYTRRRKLEQYEYRWIPDALDLLLHLSDNPARYNRVEDLAGFRSQPDSPGPLRWADVEADDPIDRQDDIWMVPEYSDFSSDDDEIAISSNSTSPATVRERHKGKYDLGNIFDQSDIADDDFVRSELETAQFWRHGTQVVAITEKQVIREVLFMMNGLQTSIFRLSDRGIRLDQNYQIAHLRAQTSRTILSNAALLGSEVAWIRRWLSLRQDSSVMQLLQSRIRGILELFDRSICQMQNDILHERSSNGVISLLQTLEALKKKIAPLQAVLEVLPRIAPDDPVSALNALHRQIELAGACGAALALKTLTPIFLSALKLYSAPIDTWLLTGAVENTRPFFIKRTNKPRNATTLWHDWFAISDDDKHVPVFLRAFVPHVFATGKTAAFLQHLQQKPLDSGSDCLGLCGAVTETAHLLEHSAVPLSATLEAVFNKHLTGLLTTSTAALKDVLESACGLNKLLDAFDYLYLGKDGVILDKIDFRLFDQIDRCVEMWNDRFLVADLVAEAYHATPCVDADNISVTSSYTSSRSMESRRRSVKILTSLTLSYHLPWPVANVISPASITVYQRIALTLCQIRRARCILERRAFFHVQNAPLGTDPGDQPFARAVYMGLAHFVNVLYAHLTTCAIGPMTRDMRGRLTAPSTGSVDDMIAIHAVYVRDLELACLSSARVKPLRDAVVAVLDLCIRFADVVSAPTSASTSGRRGSVDFEASSFISARSQRRRRRTRQEGESDDDDDDDEEEDDGGMGEGYSTFILDEDSSVRKEIQRVKDVFQRHVTFLLAGLRGVSRTAGGVGDGLELLADSLESVFPTKRTLYS